MDTVRFHLDVTMPVRPPMATAIWPAARCGDGHYRQCVDVPSSLISKFRAYADTASAVLRYTS
jgi:hypothetical protein